MFDYKEFLDSVDRKAYHEGEMQWEEDGYTVTRTYNYTGPGCHNSCGVLLYVKDGKLEKVEGDPLDPTLNGRLCMRCIDLPEATNHPDRIKYPMKRIGLRGENKWERISWDEALVIIKDELKKLEDAGYGRESILVNHGTGRNINWQVPFVAAAALGTPNIGAIYYSGFSCNLPRTCGSIAPMGDFFIADASQQHPDRYASPDWKAPDLIVVWGCEPLRSNSDGFLGHWLLPCVQQGSRVISIDPVLTWWGARAEYWLPIRPGTDAALALAWLHIIIEEDIYDHEFVDLWCAYFDELSEHVKQYTPEWAAEVCGVDVDLIYGSARMFAESPAATVQWGLPFDTQVASMECCMSVLDLISITGNIDKPGTNILVRNAFEIQGGYGAASLFCEPEVWAKKQTTKSLGIAGESFIDMAASDGMSLAMESHEPYPIKMVWIQSSNAVACSGLAAPRIWKTLKEEVDFCVVADIFVTPMAVAFADLLLPIAMSAERDSARTWWTPLRAMKKVVSYYEAKTDEEVALWLGKALNPKIFEHWNSVEELLDSLVDRSLLPLDENGKIPEWVLDQMKDSGSRYRKIAESGNIYTRFHQIGDYKKLRDELGYIYDPWLTEYEKYAKGMLRPDGNLGFATATGRIELIPPTFTRWGIDPHPTHTESIYAKQWLSDEEYRNEYPFVFINGSRSWEFFHSEHRQLPTMREFHPDPIVKVSPETAEEYDIKDGDWIWMENQDGRCKQKVQVFPGMDKRFISCEHGWWFPEQEAAEPSLYGVFDSNPNCLTHPYETGSGGVGAPIKTLFCKIYKVKEGDTLPGEQIIKLGGFRDYEPGKI